ncbi:MAG TPA: hypothetical protein VHP80_04320 [Candidatus Acidoferrum sp.]|nr:hypothetical protein [Candidatus Acidoferrum sp.]
MSERNKGIALAVLVVVAVLAWYYERSGDSVTATSAQYGEMSYKPLAVENPALQRDKQSASQKTEYKGSGRDLFSEIAPPPPQEVRQAAVTSHAPVGPQIPPPPPPPTLPGNMKFFGYGTIPNGTAKRAFLTDGDNVYIVGEGDTLLGKYRVTKIGNANLDFEEIASGRHGSTQLTEEPVAAPAS